ncbi:MAG TPA: hypothetical protein VE090_01990 [Methylomirabilota bacterium]|nr:hypothetical protein [Methylomirabilota bacterium]
MRKRTQKIKKVLLIKAETLLDNLAAGWLFLAATSIQSWQGLLISLILAIVCLGISITITLLLKND